MTLSETAHYMSLQMPVSGPTERPFVGRVAEREGLAAHIAAARGGSGRVVLVRGEPGVGKTRLVEESVAAVAPARVLWGRCQEMEGAPAFWPWVQVLRAYALATPPEQLRAELGDDAPLIARLVPAVATRCPGASLASEETLDPEAARFRLFDAVTMFLRAVVGMEPLVVVLDDLHWADNESLLLLAFVGRFPSKQRWLTGLLLFLYILQILLIEFPGRLGVVVLSALHPVNAGIMLWVAMILADQAWRLTQTRAKR